MASCTRLRMQSGRWRTEEFSFPARASRDRPLPIGWTSTVSRPQARPTRILPSENILATMSPSPPSELRSAASHRVRSREEESTSIGHGQERGIRRLLLHAEGKALLRRGDRGFRAAGRRSPQARRSLVHETHHSTGGCFPLTNILSAEQREARHEELRTA